MYYSSKVKRDSGGEGNGGMYPDATIRDYLNMKRITKDKGCLIVFILYCIALVIMMGIGFFYGNYASLGITVNDAVTDIANRQQCTDYVSQDLTTCVSSCDTTFIFLQKVCATSSYAPTFTDQVDGLISMYNLKYTFDMIAYTTAGLLIVTAILFAIIVYLPKIIYVYIVCLFIMLLSLAFYLLKNVQLRISDNGLTDTASLFYQNEESIRFLSFLLLGIYLLIFPFIMFSPKKIQLATVIIGGLKQYYSTMFTMNLFTFLVVLLSWGSLILQIFLVIHFYTAGTISQQPADSMFYTYTGIYLYHPAALVFHFIGVYWLWGTVISWHKYFTSSAMCLWYFQESQHLYPVKRGLKRSLFHVGSAAVDAIMMPIEWVLLLCYSITKLNPEDLKEDEEEQSTCATNCLLSFRQFINKRYRSFNRNAPSSGVLTNFNYFDSCEIAATMFAQNNHRFFNIGGTVTIFMTLFVCMLWILIQYLIMYFQIYNRSFPPPISSMVLPMFSVFLIGLVIGSLFANLYTGAIDCLLFCYLMERKNMIEGEQPRAEQDLRIKQKLDSCYYKSEEEKKGENLYVYEEIDENTLQMTYVTRRQ